MAPVTNSFLLLVAMHLLLVAWHLLLVAWHLLLVAWHLFLPLQWSLVFVAAASLHHGHGGATAHRPAEPPDSIHSGNERRTLMLVARESLVV